VSLPFDEMFEAEFASLHAYLYRRLGGDTADDLTAETFTIAFRRWDEFDQSRPVRPWLFGIAANLVRHHWRKERRMLRAYARGSVEAVAREDEVLAERLEIGGTGIRSLAAALAKLRHEERDVLLLCAWAELSDVEIAEALSLPVGTVKSRLHRARERMRNQLGDVGKVNTRNAIGTMKEGS
jgi:RNA polymerase sigma factor (sigma-70 family)